jgi:hypothetical protein
MRLTRRPTRWGTGRGLAAITGALVLAAAGTQAAIADGEAPAAPRGPIVARAARTESVNDTGHLKLLHASGEILTEEGPISGTIPGTVKVRLEVGTTEVRASFTIEPSSGGSIVGTGRAKISSSAKYSSFAGSLSVTGGTGRYAHARGSGKLYGALERRHDHLTVQTREGTLHY